MAHLNTGYLFFFNIFYFKYFVSNENHLTRWGYARLNYLWRESSRNIKKGLKKTVPWSRCYNLITSVSGQNGQYYLLDLHIQPNARFSRKNLALPNPDSIKWIQSTTDSLQNFFTTARCVKCTVFTFVTTKVLVRMPCFVFTFIFALCIFKISFIS